ncbi:evolutionarily conserved signaling intermediate in Toll pathway, mitochondrial [Diachasmimorpha longicaudata]|uniref:evolutionarily conserved signaling intermediate in Toll pathway, mitochondrial n=1 Tax=Diachasmimorpha longicaudata TaxID=58733 RepID=UPI0030B8A1F7
MLPSVILSTKCLRILQHRQPFDRILLSIKPRKSLHTSSSCLVNTEKEKSAKIALFSAARKEKKEKETYLNVIYTYKNAPARKTGHVQFIYAALRYMDEFGVSEDLEVYKAVIDTLPKGRFVCRNLLQAEFMLYPREQQCAIDLLEKMEENGVIPDEELELMYINIFGELAIPLRKLRRMTYWQGKFKNMNPWPWPKPMPNNPLDLAKMAIEKIASVDVQSKVSIFDTENVKESIDKTWIVSASSPDQERLIAEHPKDVAAYVEGPYKLWISKGAVDFFLLTADPRKTWKHEGFDVDDISNYQIDFWRKNRQALALQRSIHEQEDKTIFGVCATGTSSKDSLLSWIRCLQPRNPALEQIPILFKFTQNVDEQQQVIGAGDTGSPIGVEGETTEKIGV